MKKSPKGIGFIGLLIALAIIGYLTTLMFKRDPAGQVAIPAEIGKDLGLNSTTSSSKATMEAVQTKLDDLQVKMKAREERIENDE